MVGDEIFLGFRHGAAHQCDAGETSRLNFHAIKKSFDYYDAHLPFHPMQVKEFTLPKPYWKFVTGFRRVVYRTPGIADEFAIRVMDWHDDSPLHTSGSRKI